MRISAWFSGGWPRRARNSREVTRIAAGGSSVPNHATGSTIVRCQGLDPIAASLVTRGAAAALSDSQGRRVDEAGK